MKWLLAAPLLLTLSAPGPARAGTSHAAASPSAKQVLPFIEDDYAKALGSARAHELPLFVEVWAPW